MSQVLFVSSSFSQQHAKINTSIHTTFTNDTNKSTREHDINCGQNIYLVAIKTKSGLM